MFGLAATAYHSAMGNGFCLDDTGILFDNQFVADLAWANLWTTNYWQGVTGNTGGLYRPLSLTLITVERWLFGEAAALYHVVSILLQSLAAGGLVAIARRGGSEPASAWLAGALLCVHPAATEVVNAVVGTADLLVFLTGMTGASILVAGQRTRTALLGAVLIAIAALFKESAAVFAGGAIVALLLHDRRRSLLLASVAALALPVVLRVAITGHLDPGGIGFLDNPLAFADTITRWLNAPSLVLRYLFLVVFPWPLSADHSYDAIPVIDTGNVLGWLPPLLVCLSLIPLLWLMSRRSRHAALWGGTGVATMALATHAVIPVGTMYAERLAYPLLAGGCIGAAVLMTQLRRFGGGWLRWSVICVCLLFLLGLTRDRTRSWQDDGTLFASALRVRGGSARVHYGWGLWQQQQGQHAAALDSYQQALRIHPRYPDALYNQGAALLRLGRTVEALASYEAATRARPGHVQGLFAVAAIKEALGAVDASVAYLEVLQHRPGHVEAARGAARCLAAQGDSAAAEVILQRVFAGSAQSEWRRLTQP